MCVCVFQVNFITCQTGRRSRVVTQDWRNLFYLGLDVSRIVDMTCLCDPIGPFFLLLLLLIHLEVLLWLIKYQPRPHSPEVQSSSRALFPWFSLSPSISRPVHQTACPSRGKRAGESVFFFTVSRLLLFSYSSLQLATAGHHFSHLLSNDSRQLRDAPLLSLSINPPTTTDSFT